MWVEVTLCKDKPCLPCFYISHRESNNNNLHEVDHEVPFSNECVDIPTLTRSEKCWLWETLMLRVGTYQMWKPVIM